MRVAVVGPSRFGLGEPFAGGLEAHTASLARHLHDDGHDVTVYAGPTGAPHDHPFPVIPIIQRPLTAARRLDTSNPAWFAQRENEGYARISEIVHQPARFDVIHNNSLHRRLVDADRSRSLLIHTLHCPPFPTLRAAHRRLGRRHPDRTVIAVSNRLAAAWGTAATAVVHNGVDLHHWRVLQHGCAPRGHVCAWAGRIIADKAPHLAIDAALAADHHITLAGPVHDATYFDRMIRPRLRSDAVTWLGPLDVVELRRLFNDAAVGLMTPVWDEPFGLVAAEMLACGLPIASFDKGAIAEFTTPAVVKLAAPGDIDGLASAIGAAHTVDRSECRRWAEQELSIATMTARYVALYEDLVESRR